MARFFKSAPTDASSISKVEGIEAFADFVATLKDGNHFVHYVNGGMQALINIDSVGRQVFYVDPMGRPMPINIKEVLVKKIPAENFHDISRNERLRDITNTAAGFGADTQKIYSGANWLQVAIEKINSAKVPSSVFRP